MLEFTRIFRAYPYSFFCLYVPATLPPVACQRNCRNGVHSSAIGKKITIRTAPDGKRPQRRLKDAAGKSVPRKPHLPRLDKEQSILDAVERLFAQYGFEGVSLEASPWRSASAATICSITSPARSRVIGGCLIAGSSAWQRYPSVTIRGKRKAPTSPPRCGFRASTLRVHRCLPARSSPVRRAMPP